MPDQYDADKRTVGELLSMTSPNLEVPDWQRNYSWNTAQVGTFWQDLISFSDQYPAGNIEPQEYFIGSIVLVVNGNDHTLLDGQQRLATATILLSVIRDFLAKYNRDSAIRTSQKYITDFDDESGTHTFKLTMNLYDRDFFRREVQEFPTSDTAEHSPTLLSHELVRRTRKYFTRRFEDTYEHLGGGEAAHKWALRVRKVLTEHMSVVAVKSEDEDNAANVFETLNDRGIGLSTPDLLRNLILRRAEDADRAEVIECWRAVLEVEEEANVEDFLRHYWLSRRGDVKTRGLYREMKHAVLKENMRSLDFSRDLRQAADVYRDLVSGRDDDPDLGRLLRNVDALGAKLLFPAILSAYATGGLEDKKRLLHALISLFVRHNVIGNLENSRLETVVFGVARQLRADNDFSSAIERLRNFGPGDKQFAEQFKTASVSRQKTARYILRELEFAKRKTQELEVGAPDRVHVEHIYPRTPKAGRRWEKHDAVINRLGNLTLLASPLNAAIRNDIFSAKKPKYGQSELILTRELLDYNHWTQRTIDRRQAAMSVYAPSIWGFPG